MWINTNMEVEDVLKNLASSIEESKHKELICGGLALFSDFLQGRELEFDKLREPIRSSTKIVAHDIEQQMLRTADDTEDSLRLHRCIGKYMKKELLESVGDSLTKEEKQQYNADKKLLIESLVDNCL